MLPSRAVADGGGGGATRSYPVGVLFEQAVLLSVPVALLIRCTLVCEFLTFRDADLQLHQPLVVEVAHKRHQRHTFTPGGVPELRDLASGGQQFAPPPLLVLPGFGLIVGRNVGVHEPELAIVHLGIAFGYVRAALAKGLHLRAEKLDAHLEITLDGILAPCPPVFGDHLVVRIVLRLGHRLQITAWRFDSTNSKLQHHQAGFFVQTAVDDLEAILAVEHPGLQVGFIDFDHHRLSRFDHGIQ